MQVPGDQPVAHPMFLWTGRHDDTHIGVTLFRAGSGWADRDGQLGGPAV